MGNIVFWMSVSIDGFHAGPNGDLGWHSVDDDLLQYFNDYFAGIGALLEGRVVYELMADYWPTADQDPQATKQVKEFAGIWRELPKVVYSRTLESVAWNARLARDVVRSEVEALKSEYDGDLVVGGAELAHEFRRQGLIDEYVLYVHPAIVGVGTPAFASTGRIENLTLVETRAFGNGVVRLRYLTR